MNDLLKSTDKLKKLYNDYKIIKEIEQFIENISDLKMLLIKAGNYESSQKVVFIGRGGNWKSDLVSTLKNLSMPHENNHSNLDSCLKINLSKSEKSILKKVTIFDTPCYNYSDESDNEIVEKCKDANIFVVVLNSVGSIGDTDKRFLKRISEKTFVTKLIFIFTNLENVPQSDLIRTTGQHKLNACGIANEILLVEQTNIPIFFIGNNKLDIGTFLPLLDNFDLTIGEKNDICENVREILRKLQKLIEDEQRRRCRCREKEVVNENASEKQIINEKLPQNENCELYDQKLKLIQKWRDNLDKSIYRVDKNEDFKVFSSTSENKKTKIVIEKKLEDIKNFTKNSENNKIPQHILSIIDEFVNLIDKLIHFSKKINVDQLRSLSRGKYGELIDFANNTIDRKLFGRISILLVDFQLSFLLISIYFGKHKVKIIAKHSAKTRRIRKAILRNIIENTTNCKISSEIFSDERNNEIRKPINEPIEFPDKYHKANEILGTMLATLKFMIQFSNDNRIFVKAGK